MSNQDVTKGSSAGPDKNTNLDTDSDFSRDSNIDPVSNSSFFDLLQKIKDHGLIKSPDFVAITHQVLETVSQQHPASKVAFITSAASIGYDDFKLSLLNEPKDPLINPESLFLKTVSSGPIDVTSSVTETTDLNSHRVNRKNAAIKDDDAVLSDPAFIVGYKCWDYEGGHYDPLTDIFQLGQIFASVAYNLDFRQRDDLSLFVENRKRLYFLNKDLHPTIHAVIFEMTELYREDRTKNLDEVIAKLQNYRDYNPEQYVDLTETEGFRDQDVSNRTNWILAKLKNRLFDISRRNKLLYFSDRKRFLNLTIGSVPLLLDHENIREDSVLFWNNKVRNQIIKKQTLNLNSFLEFKENRFLLPSLNTIRLEAKKSQNEYGFSQMRLVVAFLHWYNFKESPDERISSPLLLLPAEVVKKKGVKDQYTLKFSTSEAEINPILSHYLKELYAIELPDFIDLDTTSIDELVDSIQTQIAAGGTGIQVKWRKKPKIQLIYSIAKKNFSLKSKKLRNRSRGLDLRDFDYSYSADGFQPLGLQIFNSRIRSRNNTLEYIINEDLQSQNNFAVAEKTRTFYRTDNDGAVNPLIWEIDTCNLTIGNFNYRKMSLVRDYNDIINSSIHDEVFEKLFSELPKKIDADSEKYDISLEDQFPIVLSDPTQSHAVALARTGESYIIQGPPGTGKSQTITNLIADYIARDKKILFVCEKRAALDVVFHRLKNRGLDEFCCLIHDSQMDKKAFIQDLKHVYNLFLTETLDTKSISDTRRAVVSRLNQEINEISDFHNCMVQGDVTPFEILETLHTYKEGKIPPSELECIYLPSFDSWKENKEWITEWLGQLGKNDFKPYISDYPLLGLSEGLVNQSNPKLAIIEHLDQCTKNLDSVAEFLEENDADDDNVPLRGWLDRALLAKKVIGLSASGKIRVLDSSSNVALKFLEEIEEIEQLTAEYLDQIQKNHHWKYKFNRGDTESACDRWNAYQSSIFRFLSPGFYRLKNKITGSYDFAKHDIQPTIVSVLENLKEEHEISDSIEQKKAKVVKDYCLQDYQEGISWIKDVHASPSEILTEWMSTHCHTYIQGLNEYKDRFDKLFGLASELWSKVESLSLSAIDQKIQESRVAISSLSVFLPYLRSYQIQESALKSWLLTKKWDESDFNYNLAYKSLRDVYETNRNFAETDSDSLQLHIDRIGVLLDKFYDSNVDYIQAKIRDKFLDTIRITESTASQLTQEEKVLKKKYLSGRRILENEFGKSMRYKSIRDLASGDVGDMLTTIKPVWLMSPLSVSDILPIDTSIFDVVIYDEASQITVEEGVPSFYRTHQAIVVGDEMQMPPTNFFSSTAYQEEEEEETEERIGISLDAESLLSQSSRKLSSVMLGWHYRSRHESLISFSNAAFYQRGLLTIPDTTTHNSKLLPIAPILDVSIPVNPEHVLGRSISFHYLENAVYENRKNKDEAEYIANIVCQLLKSDSDKSIGIVAFSMDQQSEIEGALDKLAQNDSEFGRLLEDEYQREDEDQFNGLFVKNLENVQGDERDIIIMSVCYGTNVKGKILMNFGPINRRGGEKRLNVIFSRAKSHMVVVSSLLSSDITNDYNEGANYFKRFLNYAKFCSDGRDVDANLVLDSMHTYDDEHGEAIKNNVIIELSAALREKRYDVDVSVGRSHFKCDIAIKKNKNATKYDLGILVDKLAHYQNANILEQYSQKPDILTAFGWTVESVYSKDWFENPERVLKKIESKLSGQTEAKGTDVDTLITDIDSGGSCIEVDNLESLGERAESRAFHNGEFERLELKNDVSNKFWQICQNGNKLVVQYGRIGNTPQEKEKDYPSQQAAEKDKMRLIAKKRSKGYEQV